jgi:BirA family transcriptional regulator, biotin operon repressor / biotin---[acetyl-CoA-carboxylase] ligase
MSAAARDALWQALSPPARAALGALRVEACVDSTSSVLLREAPALPDRAALLADAQSAGRGRRGRSWQSPPGANLYLSLFARLGLPLAALGGLSVAAGIGCVEALRAAGIEAATLKWPNDLLVDGAKLGGLLVEIAGGGDGETAVVIGLGLNLAMPDAAAQAIDQPWTDLARLGFASDRIGWAARMLEALLAVLDRFEQQGLAGFAARWTALDAFAGREVEVIAGREHHVGTIAGLAADGALRLRCADGERHFHSADVSLRAR